MQIDPTPIAGVFVISAPAAQDMRGSFRRLWCRDSFARAGIMFSPVQSSLSFNHLRHTLRGLHWQAAPHAEQKLVRCIDGAVWDVAVDLRPDQPTYRHWHAERLDASEGRALFLPRGVAHGFLTLTDAAAVEYLIDHVHSPDSACGARWDDPAFGVDWPAAPAIISDRDLSWPDHADG